MPYKKKEYKSGDLSQMFDQNIKVADTIIDMLNDGQVHDIKKYDDLLAVTRLITYEDSVIGHKYNLALRKRLKLPIIEAKNAVDYHSLYQESLLVDAPNRVDEYLQYLEWNRDPKRRFYMPRRKVLKPVVDDMQDLADGKIKFLGISLPPRVGKTTLALFFMSWWLGNNPSYASVMSGHSGILTKGFHKEMLSIMTDSDIYQFGNVFPIKMAEVSMQDCTIDLGQKKRYPTLTSRSIGATLTGAVEVGEKGLLYTDDLIEDLEESLNMDRLDRKYDAYLNQLKDRKKDGATELMVGTRWNTFDPLGRIANQYDGNPEYRFRVIPALNNSAQSNFDYPNGVGFSTEYYMDMKESIDDATWCAKYIGNPYIREGLLLPADELRYYNGVLPEGEPDRIVMVNDVAWGGGDAFSAPFGYIYGDDCYIPDVIFNKGDKEVTRPLVVGKILYHRPHRVRFEANNGGHEYADIVDGLVRAEGFSTNITAIVSPSSKSKMSRIIQYSPEIKRMYFLAPEHRDEEYEAFMRETTLFTQSGKNKHDDAPDSLAMLADEISSGIQTVEVFSRRYF